MKKLPIEKTNLFAFVDDEDFERCRQYKWGLNSVGYAITRPNGKAIFLHRLVVNAPAGQELDHRNRNKLDCQKHNIRYCTHQQNCLNRSKRKDGKNPYKGVYQRGRRWLAKICFNGQYFYLGYHDTAEIAAEVYNQKASELFGEFFTGSLETRSGHLLSTSEPDVPSDPSFLPNLHRLPPKRNLIQRSNEQD